MNSPKETKTNITRRYVLKMAGGVLALSLLPKFLSPADVLAADNGGKPMKIVVLTGSPHPAGNVGSAGR